MTQTRLDSQERRYVDGYFLLDGLLQHIEANRQGYSVTGNEARLLISTCRNHYLTINAVFADVRSLLVPRSGASHQSLLAQLRDPSVQSRQKSYKKVEGAVSVACKAAREKFNVWRRASNILNVIGRACDEFSPRRHDRDAIQEILATPADAIDGEAIEDPRYVALDSTAVPLLQAHERLLDHIVEYAENLLKLVKSIVAISAADPRNLLFGDPMLEDWEVFYDCLATTCPILGGTISSDGKSVELMAGDQVTLIKSDEPSHESVRALLASLTFVEDTLERQILQTFPPNTAKRRLPSIFRMELPMEHARASEKSLHAISTQVVDLNDGSHASFMVGCPGFGMPLGWYQEDIRRFTEIGRQQAIELLSAMLERIKATKCCRVLLLPEYFVPVSMQSDISRFCEEAECIAIYGLEACNSPRDDGAVINEAIVDFSAHKDVLPPELREQSARAVISKCFPSKFEPKLETTSAVTVYRQTPIGSFGVVICSDLLEHNVIDAIHRCPTPINALFVIAMNPSPGIFEPIVKADAARLHCPVVVSANCVSLSEPEMATAKGTGIAEPKRHRRSLELRASNLTIDSGRRIIESPKSNSADDSPTVSFESEPKERIENGAAPISIFEVDYSYMNDLRTSTLARSHLPPSSSTSLNS